MANVLVVDDESSVRRTFSLLLADDGHATWTAADADEALAVLEARDIDVVVSDIVLPTLSGVALLEVVAERWERIRVILVTGEPTVETAARAVRAGAYDYLTKPVTPQALQDVVGRAARMKALQDDNLRLQRELESVNRELEAFSRSVSHDLRAPLRAIGGFSEALERDYGAALDETGRTYLARVRANVAQMAELIEDLLSLSRATRAELIASDVDLAVLARDVARDLRSNAPRRAVELTIGDDLIARGDRRLLRVVLRNLLGNAWKFTEKRDQAVVALARVEVDGERAFAVSDNGAGFDMAYADKLFGVFERLHSAREFDGTGVGLAIVERIVRRHGGRVWARGAVDQGATIYFTLPNA